MRELCAVIKRLRVLLDVLPLPQRPVLSVIVIYFARIAHHRPVHVFSGGLIASAHHLSCGGWPFHTRKNEGLAVSCGFLGRLYGNASIQRRPTAAGNGRATRV